jgi:peptidoglycan/LPS O-acetylase OafA/YrhL
VSGVMQFRKDINGLRAIAVIAVVLFHFNAAWLPGGFAGVDVFFVISGFLMTGIIFRGIEQANFSIFKFYVARGNRIIPALAVLCLVLLSFGWFYLTHLEFRALSKHVSSSMGFFSNIIYWSESGYFDAASSEKWLLHTWSLSVEWQFYIIYPLVLVAMRKLMSIKAMKATVLLLTVLGFIFCVIATYKWPDTSYYLLPTRAWEMMIGGVAYLYPIALQEKRKKLVEWFGIILVMGSYFFISKDNPWPGYLALFPVLGSFLIIQAQRNDSFITSNIISQKIGAWSYSIYLWHWPLVVAIYYYSLNEVFIYIGITLSVLLGFLSNKYIEKIKFRNDFDNLFSYRKCMPLYIFLVIGFIGGVSYKYEFNLISQAEELLIGHYYVDSTGELVFNENNKVQVLSVDDDFDFLMVGDSNTAHFSYGITNSNNLKIATRWSGSCYAFLDMNIKPYASWMDQSWKNNCHSLYEFVDFNKEVPVIVAHSWGIKDMECVRNCTINNIHFDYSLILNDELEKLIQYIGNRPVFIVGQVPAPEKSMVKCMRSFKRESCDRVTSKSADRVAINTLLENISKLYGNVFFINPFNAICSEKDECATIINDKNVFYDDDGHLSAFGSKKIWPYIEKEIIKKLSAE